jgi:hypothetical protein
MSRGELNKATFCFWKKELDSRMAGNWMKETVLRISPSCHDAVVVRLPKSRVPNKLLFLGERVERTERTEHTEHTERATLQDRMATAAAAGGHR